jgi:streptogramin lyase
MKCILITILLFGFCHNIFSQNPEFLQTKRIAYSVATDLKGNLWMLTDHGLEEFTSGNWNYYDIYKYVSDGIGFKHLCVDRFDNKWIGYMNHQIAKYDDTIFTLYTMPIPQDQDGNYDSITSIASDSSGIVWIGTANHGLISFDGNAWEVHNKSIGNFPINCITNIKIDKKGNKWISGFNSYPTDSTFIIYYNNEIISSFLTTSLGKEYYELISDLCIDNSNNLWICMYSSILKYDGINWTSIKYPASNSDFSYLSCDENNCIWVAGSNSILKYDGSKWDTYLYSGFRPYLSGLTIDTFDQKWILSLYGIILFKEGGVVTSIYEDDISELPIEFSISNNFPNPFNPTTTIEYYIPYSTFVSIEVSDILGNKVKTLLNEQKYSGNYKILFDASNLTSGVYFYTLRTNNYVKTKKMVFLK